MTRRWPAVSRFRPGAAGRIFDRLGLDAAAPPASSRAVIERLNAGAPVLREDLARFRKSLIRALLPVMVSHQSGVYKATQRAVSAALQQEALRNE